MSWFQKFLGLGKKGDTVLTLKLCLNRWRHFLKTEWACGRLLADLREKHRGEYIFDRQYVFSTVGQLFQKAYQMTYDGLILREDQEMGLYLKLDQLKENTQAYLSGFTRGGGNPACSPAFEQRGKGAGEGKGGPLEEGEDLDQEPEFQILKGVIELLDTTGPNAGNPWPEKIEEVLNLRMALRFAHEQVLQQFIKPEVLQHWITTGIALPLSDTGDLPLYVIDLGKQTVSDRDKPRKTQQFEEALASCKLWPLFYGGLSLSSKGSPREQRKERPPLFVMVSENSLFLYGSSPGGTLILDMVLTSVRELNHFFFRWQAGSGDSPFIRNLNSLWEWTDQQEEKVYELAAFQKPPKEIERYGTQIGQGLALW
ncbi:MAG: hypothetical protein V2B13_03920 [Pseudomonadota bacterium]